jgi:hypothetical protein
MSIASQPVTYYRTIPLMDDKHQEYSEISASEVPPLCPKATVSNATPRSIRYDSGQESWWVNPRDKTIIRAYTKRRSDAEVNAGAFRTLLVFRDEKGPL